MPNFISEDDIEKALVERLCSPEFGLKTLNCYTPDKETLPDQSGRSDKREVVLKDRLREALVRLNPDLPEAAIDLALGALTQSRTAMSAVAANQAVYELIRNGVQVTYRNAEGRDEQARAGVIDFDT